MSYLSGFDTYIILVHTFVENVDKQKRAAYISCSLTFTEKTRSANNVSIVENQPKRRWKSGEVWVHLLVWALILNMPLLSPNASHGSLSDYLFSLIFPLSFAAVFYINYYFLIRKFFYSRQFVGFVVANIIVYSVCAFVIEISHRYNRPWKNIENPGFKPPDDFQKPPPELHGVKPPFPANPNVFGMVFRIFIGFAMATGVSIAVRTTTQWFNEEERRKELEREHLKSELLNLKNQLNPHFLFNTLNNIYGLIIQDQEKAQDAVYRLSKLMRYLLYDSNEKFVSLQKEIDFMHHYIDLMKLRVTSNVTVDYKFISSAGGHTIAPLLFISLIENGFKHGVSHTLVSEITMDLTINTEKKLIFRIRNTSFPKSDTDRSGSGIGLENLKKRLALLYPDRHHFEINVTDNYYEAKLTLLL